MRDVSMYEDTWFLGYFYDMLSLLSLMITVVKYIFKIMLSGQYLFFSNWSVWRINGTLTGTTTLSQSGFESNGNEDVTLHFPKLHDWSFTTAWSFTGYTWYVWWHVILPASKYSQDTNTRKIHRMFITHI